MCSDTIQDLLLQPIIYASVLINLLFTYGKSCWKFDAYIIKLVTFMKAKSEKVYVGTNMENG